MLNVRNAFVLYEGFYFHADFYDYTPRAFERSVRRHRAMLKAIKNGDAEKAEEASRLHIRDAVKLLKNNGQKAKTN